MMFLRRIMPRLPLIKYYYSVAWKIYFKRYINIIESGGMPDKKLICKLIFAWGNPRWSAQEDYIETMITYANQTDGLIFECGSGLSTLLLGVIAKKKNLKMVSFEHSSFWAKKVQKRLDKNELINNTLYIRPLINYGDFYWYDINNTQIMDIMLCICDAPPHQTVGGRKGFLFLFKDKVTHGTVILVDDTNRGPEQEMIKEWQDILPMEVVFNGENDQHAILKIE